MRGQVRKLVAGMALLACAASARAEGGTLVIVGGGLSDDNAAVLTALLDARPADAPRIAIIPAASGEPQASADAFAATLQRHGAKGEDIVTIPLALGDDPGTPDVDESTWRDNAADADAIAAIEGAGAIWFTGGDQSRITSLLLTRKGEDTPMLAAIRRRLAAGAVVGGTSAGAAIMSGAMITQGDSLGALIGEEAGEPLGLARGLGFLPGALVDQHFGERARLGRLAVALTDERQPFRMGLGIDEDTAIIVKPAAGSAQVAGSGYVTLLDARTARRTAGKRTGIAALALGLAGPGDRIELADLRIVPAPFRKLTIGREYVDRPLPDGGGMAYGAQDLATVAGEGLIDNAAAKAVERHSFAGTRGVTYRFVQSASTRGWWGRDGDSRAHYTIDGVAFAIAPITVEIRKVTD
ncbi:cyanophycinase [Porphyrobacter sp. YT40]|uniref:cyanophycinase n=1 Tax=Porphyrobacter sp. YT40 TaxID=2547601 RepID=UPI001144C437|nr:cyanophycinase [Porphyrobacter sp. YT40]QDH33674.1 cyanophycinase [Porphyrobacter sp. YT40]